MAQMASLLQNFQTEKRVILENLDVACEANLEPISFQLTDPTIPFVLNPSLV